MSVVVQQHEYGRGQISQVIEACTVHVERTGKWPRRWEDLIGLPMRGWTVDAGSVAEWKRTVSIDFSASVCDAAGDDAKSTECIKPISDAFGNYRRSSLPRLNGACKAACGKS
ncbi:MAG TPA: hypothetical protein VL132_20855 [Planctomycetaceae bacterium]|nr:hypothetical protein [Planctomycetaceae bacterium]